MRQHTLLLLVVLWIAHGTSSAASAQPASAAPAAPSTLEGEVANLNRSVQELLAVLKEYLGRQQTDLLFKRIEVILQRMGPLEQERRELRARKDADEEELRRLQSAMAAYQSQQDTAKPENRDEAGSPRRISALPSWTRRCSRRNGTSSAGKR
jgi:TolA-binding protein